ncbi:MAG: AAA family ATPase, partial [Paracoccus sp. (in: a-proteobacteria)]
ERTIQILCRRRKNNPLYVGEAGVGKTAIAEGLAKQIYEQQVPEILSAGTIWALDLGALLAGTKYRGDFEQRLKGVLKELKKDPDAILFIDEIHTLIGAGAASGGAMDASNILKPLLSSGEIKCIGSTTFQEYRNIFEKDRALSRRFQKVDIVEPTIAETIDILKGLKSRFEAHHKVTYTNDALQSAVELASRYINDRFLPDKAIDVIDEAGARTHLAPEGNRKDVVDVEDVEIVVAKMARIPPKQVSSTDKDSLKTLERDLKMVVFGQDEAIQTLASAVKLARSGLGNPDKPTGMFLFSGPTGVGKTEVTRQLAHVMGIELIRFDMSEYMERHSVARLIGAPPGYVGFDQGGLLTDAVTKNPHAVLLLDEIEKAHPDVFNLLLQVMDHGTLTDNNGRKADFRNVIIIMTTNAGAEVAARDSIGFAQQDHSSDDSEVIKRTFSPEFRNRLDSIIRFNALDEKTIMHVVGKFIIQLEEQLADKNVTIQVDSKARQWLAKNGYDKAMGARPMGRVIQEHLKKPLANEILFGSLVDGGVVKVELVDDSLSFDFQVDVEAVSH